ncbi:MAG: hypothetical protein KBS93_09845 [Flavobacteriaceae bacterium]|nr:hypothetical protein [Candidatus Onthonaster equi]
MSINQLQFPLDFKFHIGTLSNDFSVTDASGQSIFYVREKMFSWRDRIKVYSNSNKTELLYELTSNKLIDFQQTFTITDASGKIVGKARRKTLKSFWTATFHIYDANDNHIFTIKERSGVVRMLDGMVGEIPVIGFFTGYIFNPKYALTDLNGKELMEISKEPSFFGRKFKLDKLADTEQNDELFILSYMMLLIADRNRG